MPRYAVFEPTLPNPIGSLCHNAMSGLCSRTGDFIARGSEASERRFPDGPYRFFIEMETGVIHAGLSGWTDVFTLLNVPKNPMTRPHRVQFKTQRRDLALQALAPIAGEPGKTDTDRMTFTTLTPSDIVRVLIEALTVLGPVSKAHIAEHGGPIPFTDVFSSITYRLIR